ncbi:cyclin-dependent kinase inhibitor 4-like isoform X2 [Syzygium oleosum]|uniref:cyclin-dependent kinase inhibitor 4-like isoform X2 n=1 Tax=Syzygium oleosum TaxID=219896 RepID=UPI0024BBDDC2|nr:cyclin-dependent kinase inhibitor 4-like isoform X2 [Syzygium oleosum]
MEEHRSARRLKQAELTGAPTPAAAAAAAREEPLEPRPEERGAGEPPLPPLPPRPDSSEKISAPTSGSGEIVFGDSASSSGPSEPPRSSAGSDEESVGAAKEKLGADAVDRQQQAKSFETEASTCNGDFRETTASRSGEEEAAAAAKSATMAKPAAAASGGRPPAGGAEMPSRAELESFFSAAEKRERQRFADKYNYDVAMDAPLEGRYEWIPLKP